MSAHLSIAVFLLLSVTASAQKNNVWRGGAPGHETDWAFSKNWSAGNVPAEFDYVIIPNVSTSTGNYPVIRKGEIEVLGLDIQSGATLTLLPKARLLAETIQIEGSCSGCERRVMLEAGAKDTAASEQ